MRGAQLGRACALDGKNHQVELRLVDGGDRLMVSGDSDRLQQVMANLLSNAAKSPPGTAVTIRMDGFLPKLVRFKDLKDAIRLWGRAA